MQIKIIHYYMVSAFDAVFPLTYFHFFFGIYPLKMNIFKHFKKLFILSLKFDFLKDVSPRSAISFLNSAILPAISELHDVSQIRQTPVLDVGYECNRITMYIVSNKTASSYTSKRFMYERRFNDLTIIALNIN